MCHYVLDIKLTQLEEHKSGWAADREDLGIRVEEVSLVRLVRRSNKR